MRKLNKEIWPYQIIVDTLTLTQEGQVFRLDDWCSNTLGPRFKEWYGYNIDDKARIYAFKDEATLLVFKLAWGCKSWE